jgi:hypothetical protein
MSNLVRQINESTIRISTEGSLVGNYYKSAIELGRPVNNSTTTVTMENRLFILPEEIKNSIATIQSFKSLPNNWNTYGAEAPSENAIRNSIDFLVRLGKKQRIPSLIIPTPKGGVLVELQEGEVRLEFYFLPDNTAFVSGYIENDFKFEHPVTDTTEYCSLKWLFCPDGNCQDWE